MSDNANAWSNIDKASRTLPLPARVIKANAPASISTFSFSAISLIYPYKVSQSIRRNSYFCIRESIVAGILCGSVVAKKNFTCGGGSSNVFNNALNASRVNMCTSSMMYTLYRELIGAIDTESRNLRISSIPRFDAPSISFTSNEFPSRIAMQLSHVPHGVGVGSSPCKQFNAFANMRAIVVLPTPRVPIKTYP